MSLFTPQSYSNSVHAWREEKVPEHEWGNLQSIINYYTLITLLKNRSNDHNFNVKSVQSHSTSVLRQKYAICQLQFSYCYINHTCLSLH